MTTEDSNSFTGQLERPFDGRVAAATAVPRPLRSAHDYGIAAGFGRSHGTPVLLSYAEHFELLAALVRKALSCLPDVDAILIVARMPCGARLHPDLLREEVLLVENVDAELGRLRQADNRVLVIEDRFLRNPQEQGDNRIRLRLVPAEPAEAGGFAELVAVLSDSGVRGVEAQREEGGAELPLW